MTLNVLFEIIVCVFYIAIIFKCCLFLVTHTNSKIRYAYLAMIVLISLLVLFLHISRNFAWLNADERLTWNFFVQTVMGMFLWRIVELMEFSVKDGYRNFG